MENFLKFQSYLESDKFLFTLHEQISEIRIYRRLFPAYQFSVELEVYKDKISIFKVEHDLDDQRWPIVLRHKLRMLEDIDYLILEGMLGVFFEPSNLSLNSA